MTNKQELREAAEKATPGEWRLASTRFNGITATPFSFGGEEVMLAGVSEKRDAEFIAAASPPVVLALLDELEAKDRMIAELQKQKNDLLRELAPHIHKVSGPYGTEESIGRYAKDGSIKQSGSCYIQSHSED